jgi:hypothetical protein
MFNNNVFILCLYCNIKNNWNILLPFLTVTLHESGTRNALLGPWPNNTEVYLTPFVSTQNQTIAV